jgi:hypothetical protein
MALPAILGGITGIVKVLGEGVKAFFGYKQQKAINETIEQSNDKEMQLAWWQFLVSQDSPLNKILRPLTAAYFIGDFIYQRAFTGTYEIITIVPHFKLAGWEIGPISNGLVLTFVILVMFPLRGIEKMVLRKS